MTCTGSSRSFHAAHSALGTVGTVGTVNQHFAVHTGHRAGHRAFSSLIHGAHLGTVPGTVDLADTLPGEGEGSPPLKGGSRLRRPTAGHCGVGSVGWRDM